MIEDKSEQSFVRRWSTEPFYPVFGDSCLLLLSPYSRDDLVRSFAPSSDCRK